MTEVLDCNTIECIYNDNNTHKCKRKRIIIDKNRECVLYCKDVLIDNTKEEHSLL